MRKQHCAWVRTRPVVLPRATHPWAGITHVCAAKSWPALDAVFNRCMSDGYVMERACRTLRLAVKGAGAEGAALMPSLLAMLASRFRLTRHSAFL